MGQAPRRKRQSCVWIFAIREPGASWGRRGCSQVIIVSGQNNNENCLPRKGESEEKRTGRLDGRDQGRRPRAQVSHPASTDLHRTLAGGVGAV